MDFTVYTREMKFVFSRTNSWKRKTNRERKEKRIDILETKTWKLLRECLFVFDLEKHNNWN